LEGDLKLKILTDLTNSRLRVVHPGVLLHALDSSAHDVTIGFFQFLVGDCCQPFGQTLGDIFAELLAF